MALSPSREIFKTRFFMKLRRMDYKNGEAVDLVSTNFKTEASAFRYLDVNGWRHSTKCVAAHQQLIELVDDEGSVLASWASGEETLTSSLSIGGVLVGTPAPVKWSCKLLRLEGELVEQIRNGFLAQVKS